MSGTPDPCVIAICSCSRWMVLQLLSTRRIEKDGSLPGDRRKVRTSTRKGGGGAGSTRPR